MKGIRRTESSNGKFVFPNYLYARTKDNKTIDVSFAPQSLDAIEYVRNDSLQQEQQDPSNNLVDVDAVRENFITEVYRVLDADPTNDRANAIIYAFDSLPTISQEQRRIKI